MGYGVLNCMWSVMLLSLDDAQLAQEPWEPWLKGVGGIGKKNELGKVPVELVGNEAVGIFAYTEALVRANP